MFYPHVIQNKLSLFYDDGSYKNHSLGAFDIAVSLNGDTSVLAAIIRNDCQDVILKCRHRRIYRNDCLFATLYAAEVDNADIGSLQEIVISSKISYSAIHFAEVVEGADVEVLGDIVFKNGRIADISAFQYRVKDVNVNKLAIAVVKFGNLLHCVELMQTNGVSIKNKKRLKRAAIEKLDTVPADMVDFYRERYNLRY